MEPWISFVFALQEAFYVMQAQHVPCEQSLEFRADSVDRLVVLLSKLNLWHPMVDGGFVGLNRCGLHPWWH